MTTKATEFLFGTIGPNVSIFTSIILYFLVAALLTKLPKLRSSRISVFGLGGILNLVFSQLETLLLVRGLKSDWSRAQLVHLSALGFVTMSSTVLIHWRNLLGDGIYLYLGLYIITTLLSVGFLLLISRLKRYQSKFWANNVLSNSLDSRTLARLLFNITVVLVGVLSIQTLLIDQTSLLSIFEDISINLRALIISHLEHETFAITAVCSSGCKSIYTPLYISHFINPYAFGFQLAAFYTLWKLSLREAIIIVLNGIVLALGARIPVLLGLAFFQFIF